MPADGVAPADAAGAVVDERLAAADAGDDAGGVDVTTGDERSNDGMQRTALHTTADAERWVASRGVQGHEAIRVESE